MGRLASISRYRARERPARRGGAMRPGVAEVSDRIYRKGAPRFEVVAQGHAEIAAMAAHDMRSALNAMVGWLHMIQGSRAGPVLRARAAAGLETSIGTQRDVVEAFEHASRVVNGDVQLLPARLDVNAIAADAVERCQPRARAAGVCLSLGNLLPAPSWWADAVLADASVSALLAHGFTSLVRGQPLELAVEESPTGVSLVLRGCTMPPDVTSLTCAGAAAVDASTAGGRGSLQTGVHGCDLVCDADGIRNGTGLLLRVAGTLARLMGGRLHRSPAGPAAPDGWASLELPAAPSGIQSAWVAASDRSVRARAFEAVSSRPGVALAGVSVLLVDDRADMREVIAGLLELDGAAVVRCTSAAEAIDRHAAWAAGPGQRLIVSDLSMPEIDGLTLMRVLRARERALQLPRIPAVALTAQPGAYPAETVSQAGYDLLLAKPVQPATLGWQLSALVRAAMAAHD